MPDDRNDDDSYILEDSGETIADIEKEMEVTAKEADDTLRRGATPVPAPPSDDGASVEAETVAEDLRKLNDRYLRTLADFDNFRKRTERDKEEFRKFALAAALRDLLPVLDNFDRALDHAEEGDDFHRGVLLIYKQLWDVLQKAGLKAIDETGVKFNPNVHEGVIREEDPSVPALTVTAVLQKGYFLLDRLLRPALVKVAVGGPEPGDDVH